MTAHLLAGGIRPGFSALKIGIGLARDVVLRELIGVGDEHGIDLLFRSRR